MTAAFERAMSRHEAHHFDQWELELDELAYLEAYLRSVPQTAYDLRPRTKDLLTVANGRGTILA